MRPEDAFDLYATAATAALLLCLILAELYLESNHLGVNATLDLCVRAVLMLYIGGRAYSRYKSNHVNDNQED